MMGSKRGKKKVRGDQVRQKIWPRREMAKESDSEKGTKMMGRNKGYPRRIEVLSLRERGTEFISSPTMLENSCPGGSDEMARCKER